MGISAKEYEEKNAGTKDVTLPSGAVFTIRKVMAREYMGEMGIPLASLSGLAGDNNEKIKILLEKMTPEQKAKMLQANDRLICKSSVAPLITMTPEEGSLLVSKLTDADYYKLLAEVTAFSFGGGKQMESFREKQDAPIN